MRRVVCIAYYYPPLVGIASERAAAFSTHLRRLGWDPVIVTPRNGFYHRVAGGDGPQASVIRTRSIELSRMLRAGHALAGGRRAAGDEMTITPTTTSRLTATLRRWARDWLYLPDAQVGWIPFATRAAAAALREPDGPRVIFSSSVPYSAHLAAQRVARKLQVPWVAEFRDPWTDDRTPNRTRSRVRRRIDHHLESGILLGADHVVVPTESMQRMLMARVPALDASRISVVRNGFEPTQPGSPPSGDEAMTILYAGTVARGEDMGPVLAALDEVHDGHPGAFRLHVLGPAESWAAGRGMSWLRLVGIVSPDEARRAMADSSALLLVQQHPAYWLAVPGKAYEYIGVRRPILAVIPRGSEMESVVSRHGDARVVQIEETGQLAGAVLSLLSEHRAGTLQRPRVEASVTAPLLRREQAGELARIFERVSGPEGRRGRGATSASSRT